MYTNERGYSSRDDWFAFAGTVGPREHDPMMHCLANALLRTLAFFRREKNEMHRGGRSHENMSEVCIRKPEKQILF